jgi:hypothetical protein
VAWQSTDVDELVAAYDSCWNRVDFDGLSRLWVRSDPDPIYVGDEYPEPLVGAQQLDRHWARLSARVRQATMRSTPYRADVLEGGPLRCVLLCRWSFMTRGTETSATGASWVTWLAVPHEGRRRIALHMESEVHLAS